MAKIVVIDNDAAVSQDMCRILGNRYHIVPYVRGVLAADFVREHDPDIVFLSLELESIDAVELLQLLSMSSSGPPVVALIRVPFPRLIVDAITQGACDVIMSPVTRADLYGAIGRALSRCAYLTPPDLPFPVPSIVGMSPAIARLRQEIQKVAPSSAPVVITGESGVGKELVAAALHELSRASQGQLVARNCAEFPDSLFESEMFGTERGAFTDARSRPGALELADGGTLFLDELGDLPVASQVKILRAIETNQFYRVGATSPQRSSARLVAATNRNLGEQVARGEFREDLYYRMSVITLHVPPLRDRREDIPLLVSHFQKLLARRDRMGVMPSFTHDALMRLGSYDWPGNIRELKNVVWRSMLFNSGASISAIGIRFA